jgi:hypothetical protein
MDSNVKERRRALNKDALQRATRQPPPLKLVASIPREELGTIPKPFTYMDATGLIEKIGLETWCKWGHSKRLEALTKYRGT